MEQMSRGDGADTYDDDRYTDAHRDHASIHVPPPPCIFITPLLEPQGLLLLCALNVWVALVLAEYGFRREREERGNEPGLVTVSANRPFKPCTSP